MNRWSTNTPPHHPISKVKAAIKKGNFGVYGQARQTMKDHFGWTEEDVKRAFLKLNPKKHKHKSENHRTRPPFVVDYYKAPGLLGEDVYTHFHFDGDQLIINSLKRI